MAITGLANLAYRAVKFESRGLLLELDIHIHLRAPTCIGLLHRQLVVGDGLHEHLELMRQDRGQREVHGVTGVALQRRTGVIRGQIQL